MTCARRAGYPMCETCTAAGLVRCPSLGAPLPLVEGEKVSARVWPAAPNGMTQADLDAMRRLWEGKR